jgi:glycerol-3-phosphate O-acyltransferase
MDELTGTKQKEKESFWQLFNIYKRFKYYGRGYISFGEPITIKNYLEQNIPTWQDDIRGMSPNAKPSWLFDTVNQLSDQIIINLNASAAINGLNLSALAILSANKHTLSISKLHEVVKFYIQVLKSSPAIKQDIIPETPSQILLHQAMELHPFHIEKIDGEKYAKPSPKQIIYLTYFRNNIQHFFVLPALITTIVMVHKKISYKDIIVHTRNVFYFLRHELFSPISEAILDQTVSDYLKSFKLAEYMRTEDDMYYINEKYGDLMRILSSCIYLNLIRYLLAVRILSSEKDNVITIKDFIDKCVKKSKELPVKITDNSPEFSDPITFRVMSETLIRHQYIFIMEEKSEEQPKKKIPGTIKKNPAKLQKLVNAVGPLLPNNLRHTVK